MIRANFKLRLGDLDIDFVEKLQSLFSKNNELKIDPLFRNTFPSNSVHGFVFNFDGRPWGRS